MIGLFSNCSYGQSSDSQIVATINSFYIAYITENAKMPVNEAKVDSIKNKYCTAQLVDTLNNKELEYDPFLDAQDCEASWLNSLLVEKDPNLNYVFKVSYLDSYNNTRTVIKLAVVQVGTEYKIDEIKE